MILTLPPTKPRLLRCHTKTAYVFIFRIVFARGVLTHFFDLGLLLKGIHALVAPYLVNLVENTWRTFT